MAFPKHPWFENISFLCYPKGEHIVAALSVRPSFCLSVTLGTEHNYESIRGTQVA